MSPDLAEDSTELDALIADAFQSTCEAPADLVVVPDNSPCDSEFVDKAGVVELPANSLEKAPQNAPVCESDHASVYDKKGHPDPLNHRDEHQASSSDPAGTHAFELVDSGSPQDDISQEQYDRALFEARRQVLSDSTLHLPWETGVFASIFGDEPVKIPGPSDSAVNPSFPSDIDTFQSVVSSGKDPRLVMKRSLDVPIHTTVMSTLRDVDALQQQNDLWEAAISKWQLVFRLVGFVGRIGERMKLLSLDKGTMETERSIIRDVLGIKSPRTASKRADSLRKFFTWCNSKQCAVWPVQVSRVLLYLSGDGGTNPAATTGLALIEAFRFAKYVMDIDVGEDILGDSQLRGRINRLLVEKAEYKQARPLLCSEVALMERFVCTSEDSGDVYMVGCCLFALFSRSRWSDLRYLDALAEDRTMIDGQPFGFIESSTAIHKTSTSADRKTRHMPLVCPLLGVTGLDWTVHWISSMAAVGLVFSQKPLGALCRVITGDQTVGIRSCTSTEITKFLNAFFQTDTTNYITSHSLKETTLCWSARYGIDENSRLLLGHHELSGGRSLATYSRDMLSRPLQKYTAMLLNIRKDYFRPDLTRSGWMSSKKQDEESLFEGDNPDDLDMPVGGPSPFIAELSGSAKGEAAASHEPSDGSDVESASSTSSSTNSDRAPEESLNEKFALAMPPEVKGPLIQNNKSKVLHRFGENESITRCGIIVNEKFSVLPNGASLRWARCGRCFRGEVISNAGQAAEVLDILKSRRAE